MILNEIRKILEEYQKKASEIPRSSFGKSKQFIVRLQRRIEGFENQRKLNNHHNKLRNEELEIMQKIAKELRLYVNNLDIDRVVKNQRKLELLQQKWEQLRDEAVIAYKDERE